MIRLVKFIIIGIAVAVKFCLIIKFLNTMVKFKYVAIMAGYLVLNALKLWIHTKQRKHLPTFVYHADTHDHHFRHRDDDSTQEDWNRQNIFDESSDEFSEATVAPFTLPYGILDRRPERADRFWGKYQFK